MSGRYRTIVADPPWHYEGFATAPGSAKNPGPTLRSALPYASMAVEDIAVLPVASLADPQGAHCFLWTTNRYLPAAFTVLAAWGFAYCQTLVWRKIGNPSPFGGRVAPIHGEFLLLGRRGTPRISGRWPTSVIDGATKIAGVRAKQHSRKPDVFLDMVETVSPGPYVELFARRARFGWDYYGNESLGTASIGAA